MFYFWIHHTISTVKYKQNILWNKSLFSKNIIKDTYQGSQFTASMPVSLPFLNLERTLKIVYYEKNNSEG